MSICWAGVIWSGAVSSLWVTRLVGLLLVVGYVLRGWRRRSLKRSSALIIGLLALVFFGGLLGIQPNPEGGRWYDAQFWNSLGNTIEFVLLVYAVDRGYWPADGDRS